MQSTKVLAIACSLFFLLFFVPRPGLAAGADGSSLTPDEQSLLERGEYERRELVGGGVLGTIVGFGTGHIVQGRYGKRGWMFTAGEAGSLSATALGLAICGATDDEDDVEFFSNLDCMLGVVSGGLAIFSGFRIWEIVDVWAVPARHNERVRALKAKAEGLPVSLQILPRGKGGMTAGLALRF